jgi:hypothetical protein
MDAVSEPIVGQVFEDVDVLRMEVVRQAIPVMMDSV